MWSSTINNLGFALRAQWPWMLLLAILIVAFSTLNEVDFNLPPEQLESYFKANPGKILGFLLSLLGVGLVATLGFSSIAVSWHRYVLLDEVPLGLAKLRVDATVWRYFGNIILISLMIIGAVLPFALVMVGLMTTVPILAAISMFGYVIFVLLPLIYRLSIKLPAVALGRTDFRFGDAWAASAGNWWQIVGVGIVFSLISWAIGLAMFVIVGAITAVLGASIGLGADVVVQSVVNWVLTIMGITMLTSFYGFFVEGRDF